MSSLNEIRDKLVAPKNQFNAFGKYKYRSCEDIMKAVKPLLGEAQLVIGDTIVMIGDRFYVKATAIFKNGEEKTTVDGYARESLDKKGMDSAQITGAASSYARKYALSGLFLIDDTDEKAYAATEDKVITADQVKKIKDDCNDLDVDMPMFLAYLDVTKIEDIKTSNYNKALKALEQKREQNGNN